MPADHKAEGADLPLSAEQRLVVRSLIAEVRRSRELLGLALPLNPRPPTDDEIGALEREVGRG